MASRYRRGEMTTVEPDTLRLAAIVNASDDAIISHALDGTIETWNPAAERMFGYAAAEAIGRRVDMIVARDHLADEQLLTEEIRRGGTVRHFETVAVTKNGATIDVSLALSPLVTPTGEILGVARIARDVSREKPVERELARLAAIVDSAEDAIISKDLNGIVLTWNRAAEQVFGYQAAEMVGRSITTIIPSDRQQEEVEVLSRIRQGKHVEHFETVRQRKDGSLVEISLTVSPIRGAAGRVIGASKIARDISGQRRLVRAAEEASRVKDEFLAMLSHELRTPLNAVLGYTRMIRSGQVSTDKQDRAIDIIERNANVLSQLVSDVLDVSSYRHRQDAAESEPVRPDPGRGGRGRRHPPVGRCQGGRAQPGQAGSAVIGTVRQRSNAAGALEPARQCGEVHAARRPHRRAAADRAGPSGARHRVGYGTRHPQGRAAVHFSAILAGRTAGTRVEGRAWARPRAGSPLHRAARRQHQRRQRGGRKRRHLYRGLAAPPGRRRVEPSHAVAAGDTIGRLVDADPSAVDA